MVFVIPTCPTMSARGTKTINVSDSTVMGLIVDTSVGMFNNNARFN